MIYDISILAANTANNITIKNVLEQVVKIPEKYLPNTYFINLTVEQRESLNEGNTIYVDVDYDIYNCVEVVFFDQQPVYLKRYKTLQYFYGFGVNSRTNPGPYYYYYLAPASSNSQFKLQRSTINIPTATSELTNDAGFITSIPDEYITETELTEKAYITKEVANLTNYYKKTETEEYINNNLAIKTISENIAFVNGTKPSYTSGWYNFTGTITINGTDVSSNGYWDETSLIQIKDDGDRVYFYFIDPDDIEHKDYLSAYVYYDVEAGIWKPEKNDSVYTKKVLTKENTNEYTPTGDYNPSTKKYVDDAIAELKAYIDNAIANAVFAADAADHEPTTTVE